MQPRHKLISVRSTFAKIKTKKNTKWNEQVVNDIASMFLFRNRGLICENVVKNIASTFLLRNIGLNCDVADVLSILLQLSEMSQLEPPQSFKPRRTGHACCPWRQQCAWHLNPNWKVALKNQCDKTFMQATARWQQAWWKNTKLRPRS